MIKETINGLLHVDGSAGEGGGQILRTSLSLAAASARPFRIDAIRAGRKKPGLMRQHLTAVKAAQAVCGASVSGADIGSQQVEFHPGRRATRQPRVPRELSRRPDRLPAPRAGQTRRHPVEASCGRGSPSIEEQPARP